MKEITKRSILIIFILKGAVYKNVLIPYSFKGAALKCPWKQENFPSALEIWIAVLPDVQNTLSTIFISFMLTQPL